ncbi:hypothetical protein V8E51_000578 [Hyaloscypha variabilis]
MRQLWRASFLGVLRALSGLVLDLGLLEFLIGRTFLDRGRWDLVPAEVFSGGTRRQIGGRQALIGPVPDRPTAPARCCIAEPRCSRVPIRCGQTAALSLQARVKRRAKRQLGPLGRSTTADGTSGPGPRTHCPGGSPDTHEDFSQEQGSNGRPRVCGLQAAGAEAAEQSTSNLVVHGPLSTVHAIVLAQSGLETALPGLRDVALSAFSPSSSTVRTELQVARRQGPPVR